MYQVTFSEQAMHELNKLDKLAQLDAIDPISNLKPADLAHPREPLGQFRRGQKSLYRLRAGDFRFYFEPVSEQQLVEQHSKFWKYLESLTK
jgi:mRNA-degrading endonuclease RelE of RelBE toxin-antitoxin system